jgi:hypothetical protein
MIMMRNFRMFLVFCLACAMDLRGGSRLHFGLTGGASVTSHWSPLKKSDLYSVDTRFINGMSAGVLAGYTVSRRFVLRAECVSIEKGGVHDVSIPGFFLGTIRADYRFCYVEVPVLLEAQLLKKGRFTLHTDGGFYAASVQSARYVLKNAIFGTIEQNLSAREKWDFGFLFGAGVDAALWKFRLGAGYRYSMGMADVTLPTGAGMGEIRLRNQCYQFLVSIFY